MVFLDHEQNLHIHVVRANILMSFSVDFRSEGRCTNRPNFGRSVPPYRPPNMYGVVVSNTTVPVDCTAVSRDP